MNNNTNQSYTTRELYEEPVSHPLPAERTKADIRIEIFLLQDHIRTCIDTPKKTEMVEEMRALYQELDEIERGEQCDAINRQMEGVASLLNSQR